MGVFLNISTNKIAIIHFVLKTSCIDLIPPSAAAFGTLVLTVESGDTPGLGSRVLVLLLLPKPQEVPVVRRVALLLALEPLGVVFELG
jgi:hypothetical protein